MRPWIGALELRMLRAKFPGWEVACWDTGVGVLMWSAFWTSADGRRRVYRVAGSADALEAKLADYAWNGVPVRDIP